MKTYKYYISIFYIITGYFTYEKLGYIYEINLNVSEPIT